MDEDSSSIHLDAARPESAALMRALAEHPEQMAELIEVLHTRIYDSRTLLTLLVRLSGEAVRVLTGVWWAAVTA